MPDLCDPRKSRGRFAPGKHVMFEDGQTIRKCDPCKAGRIRVVPPHVAKLARASGFVASSGAPADSNAEPPKETSMVVGIGEAKALVAQIDWNEIQRRRNNGTAIGQLAKELGVSVSAVYGHTSPPPGSKHAGKPNGSRPPKSNRVRARGEAPLSDLGRKTLAAEQNGRDGDVLISVNLDDELVDKIWDALTVADKRALLRQVRFA